MKQVRGTNKDKEEQMQVETRGKREKGRREMEMEGRRGERDDGGG